MTKEEFLKHILTRREAESYLGLSSVALQHHLRNESIKPCKEHGRGNAKVQLFWLDDLNKFYKERFGMKEFKTVKVSVEDILETEIIESINANDSNVVGRDEGNQEIVISKVTLENGVVFGVAYETDGVADGEEYFETLEEAKAYAEYIN